MNNLQIFKNEEFGEIRTVEQGGKIWFVGKDVAEALKYSNTNDAIIRHVDSYDRANIVIHDGRQERTMIGINESGLYALIFGSKLESAKTFKYWVTHEVLPSIRQHGGYGVQTIPTELQILQGMLNKLIQQETEIKVISEQTQAIKDTIVAEYDNWREEIKRQINTIQKKSAMTYQDTYNTLYDSLEKRGRCDLSARVRNGRDRLADSGATKTKIEAFGRMDVIEADARLREIFTAIVKEYAVKYVA